MPKDTKTLGNSKARACESLGFVHKKGCARVLTQPLSVSVRKKTGTSIGVSAQRIFLYTAIPTT
ncbi:hypothetical protein DXK01_021035 [Bacteroides intestinalis]|nr:hypothetical protein DXK01_021035 [Bacteroides intestinalis]